MLRRQGFQFELMPNGQETRQLRQFAGSCRFVYNKALAINTQRYEKKEKRLGYTELCALLPGWKKEHPFLSRTSASIAAIVEESRTGVHQLLRKASRLSEVQEERSA
jgi:transposase